MRERARGIERERSQNRVHDVVEVAVRILALVFVEFVVAEDVDAVLRQFVAQLGVEPPPPHDELPGGLPDDGELLGRGQPVSREVTHPRLDLLFEAGDAHHVELGEVGTEDREELHALEQWVVVVLGLLEHALLEREHAELAVEVERRRVEVGLDRARNRLLLGDGLDCGLAHHYLPGRRRLLGCRRHISGARSLGDRRLSRGVGRL